MSSLEIMALRWLRFEKNCRVALFERTPRYWCGRPDVIGVTNARYLLEIEVKRSVQDFVANGNKMHVRVRDMHLKQWPKHFWYLVPANLVDRVTPLLPEYAGLLRGPTGDEVQQIYSVVKAQVNPSSERLSAREMITLAHCMANQILSNEERTERIKNSFDPTRPNIHDHYSYSI